MGLEGTETLLELYEFLFHKLCLPLYFPNISYGI